MGGIAPVNALHGSIRNDRLQARPLSRFLRHTICPSLAWALRVTFAGLGPDAWNRASLNAAGDLGRNEMLRRQILTGVGAAALALAAFPALAQETVKVGLILPMTG